MELHWSGRNILGPLNFLKILQQIVLCFCMSETAAKILCGEIVTCCVLMSAFSPSPLTDE